MQLFSLWGQYLGSLLSGLATTVELTLLGLAVAVAGGALLAALRSSRLRVLRVPAIVYVDLLRSIPVLVLLFIAYYGMGQLGLNLSGVLAATLALGSFYAALFAEIFRGGMQGVDRGQREAAAALGMSTAQQLKQVILPQAFVAILLPSTNQMSNIIKDSSLVVTIGVADLMSKAYQASAQSFQPMDMFILAGIIYFCVYLIISRALAKWELSVARHRS